MKQRTLAVGEFEAFAKKTRRSEFLATMNRVLPWAELLAVIEPYYAKVPSGADRRPIGGERMLRIYFLQPRVEHAFLVIKKIFGWDKVRYKGLAKNTHPLNVLCALTNLYHFRHTLSKQHPSCA